MNMDWAAIKDSEVMMNYLREEIKKEAACHPVEIDEKQVVTEFQKFEEKVKKDPKLRSTFKVLQDKFADDPEYTSKVDPKFVEGVMLLDLEQEDK